MGWFAAAIAALHTLSPQIPKQRESYPYLIFDEAGSGGAPCRVRLQEYSLFSSFQMNSRKSLKARLLPPQAAQRPGKGYPLYL